MDLSNLIVEVRTSSLERIGVILPVDLELHALVLQGDVGDWSCTISSKHPVAEALMAPGAGLIVTDAATGDVVFSGPALPTEINSVDSHGDTITVTGVTDEQVLDDMLAWPDPASDDLTSQTTDFDERTGPAETLMHEFVNVNIGSLAAGERRNLRVAEGEDFARGEVVTKAARFNNILGLLQDLAEPDGLTFRMVQVDGKLELQTSINPDQGRVIRLDTALDSVVSSRFSQTAPGLTRAIVGGRGGNASRKLHEAADDDAMEAEEDWGRRIEKFVDRQDARETADLERVGAESLSLKGGAGQSGRIEPNEALCIGFGETWHLGDTVSIAADGREHVVPVTGVILKVKNSRLRIGALLGQTDAVRASRDGRSGSAVNDAANEVLLWEAGDHLALTAAQVTDGEAVLPLSYRPVSESLTAFREGLFLPPPRYSIDYTGCTLTWPLLGAEAEGDELWVHYAHNGVTPPLPTCRIVLPTGAFSSQAGDLASTDTLVIKPPNAVTGHPSLTASKNQPTITGSGAVWGDDSDATYVTLNTTGPTSSLTAQRYGYTLLNSVAGLPAASDVTAVRLRARLAADNLTATPVVLGMTLGTFGFGLNFNWDVTSIADGTLVEITRTITSTDFTDNGYTMTDLLNGLSAGSYPLVARVNAIFGSTNNNQYAEIRELDLELDHTVTTHPAITEVGGTGSLTDSSDATYLEWFSDDITSGATGTMALSPLESYTPGDEINLHIRCSAAGSGSAHGEVFIATDSAGTDLAGFSDGTASGLGFAIPSDGSIVDLTVPLSLGAWGSTTEQDVADALMAGAYLDFNAMVSGGIVTVYEASISVCDPS